MHVQGSWLPQSWAGRERGLELLCCVVHICELPKSQPSGSAVVTPKQWPEASPALPWPQWMLGP